VYIRAYIFKWETFPFFFSHRNDCIHIIWEQNNINHCKTNVHNVVRCEKNFILWERGEKTDMGIHKKLCKEWQRSNMTNVAVDGSSRNNGREIFILIDNLWTLCKYFRKNSVLVSFFRFNFHKSIFRTFFLLWMSSVFGYI